MWSLIVPKCGSRGGGGGGAGDWTPRPLENHKLYGFLKVISNWTPPPCKSWSPPPGKCWTPSGTLKNDRFLWNWPFDLCKVSWGLKKKKKSLSELFSSPEPKALRWAISIPMTPSSVVRRPSVVRPSTFSNIFSSETTGPTELKFHMETP